MEILTYDPSRYGFAGHVRDILGTDDLEGLTAGRTPEEGWSLYRSMEETVPYKALAAALAGPAGQDFRQSYLAFVRAEIRPAFREPILYQACPTIRLLFADAAGTPRFHRDRDYGHSRREVNYHLVLTPAFGTNAIWIESAEGRADHRPFPLRPGEYLRFDGAVLSHGAVANDTGRARVSFDFRVIPAAARDGQRLTDTPGTSTPDAHTFARCP